MILTGWPAEEPSPVTAPDFLSCWCYGGAELSADGAEGWMSVFRGFTSLIQGCYGGLNLFDRLVGGAVLERRTVLKHVRAFS